MNDFNKYSKEAISQAKANLTTVAVDGRNPKLELKTLTGESVFIARLCYKTFIKNRACC